MQFSYIRFVTLEVAELGYCIRRNMPHFISSWWRGIGLITVMTRCLPL